MNNLLSPLNKTKCLIFQYKLNILDEEEDYCDTSDFLNDTVRAIKTCVSVYTQIFLNRKLNFI